jgi:hypothetical protein
MKIFSSYSAAGNNTVNTSPLFNHKTSKGTFPNLDDLVFNLANLLELRSPRFPGIVEMFRHGTTSMLSAATPKALHIQYFTNLRGDTLTEKYIKFRTFLHTPVHFV